MNPKHLLTRKPGRILFLTGLFTVVVLASTAYLLLCEAEKSVSPPRRGLRPPVFLQIFPIASGKRLKAYDAELKRQWSVFESSLAEAGDPYFQKAKKNVPDVVGSLTSWEATFRLCRVLVKDKLNGTGETAAFLNAVLQKPVIEPCVKGNSAFESAAETFLRTLSKQDKALARELSGKLSIDPIPLECFSKNVGGVEGAALKTASASGFSIGSIAVEAVFLPSTVACVQSVLNASLARAGSSAAIGSVCAVSDGPFPVGDAVGAILAAGGGIWAGYDLYQARIRMPLELGSQLNSAIENYRQKSYESARTRVRTVYDALRKRNAGLLGESDGAK